MNTFGASAPLKALQKKFEFTLEGIPAIVQLLSQRINVNVTLVFAQEIYERVAEAYLLGLELLAAQGGRILRCTRISRKEFCVVRATRRVATCVGFGPRYLHSTGQVYKGGPNSGVFLQITCEAAADLPVRGQRYTFGVVEAAQTRGDFHVLAERGQRMLQIHLGRDVKAGLTTLKSAVERALV